MSAPLALLLTLAADMKLAPGHTVTWALLLALAVLLVLLRRKPPPPPGEPPHAAGLSWWDVVPGPEAVIEATGGDLAQVGHGVGEVARRSLWSWFPEGSPEHAYYTEALASRQPMWGRVRFADPRGGSHAMKVLSEPLPNGNVRFFGFPITEIADEVDRLKTDLRRANERLTVGQMHTMAVAKTQMALAELGALPPEAVAAPPALPDPPAPER